MRERTSRLEEYCAQLLALGFKPRQIAEKTMQVTEPAPLFADPSPSNWASNYRIVRNRCAEIEEKWTAAARAAFPHAVGTYLAKKQALESRCWNLAMSKQSITTRVFKQFDPITKRERMVKETTIEGPHPLIVAAALRTLDKVLDDIGIVQGVDVKGKKTDNDPLEDLFRETAERLLEAHEARKRAMASGALDDNDVLDLEPDETGKYKM